MIFLASFLSSRLAASNDFSTISSSSWLAKSVHDTQTADFGFSSDRPPNLSLAARFTVFFDIIPILVFPFDYNASRNARCFASKTRVHFVSRVL